MWRGQMQGYQGKVAIKKVIGLSSTWTKGDPHTYPLSHIGT